MINTNSFKKGALISKDFILPIWFWKSQWFSKFDFLLFWTGQWFSEVNNNLFMQPFSWRHPFVWVSTFVNNLFLNTVSNTAESQSFWLQTQKELVKIVILLIAIIRKASSSWNSHPIFFSWRQKIDNMQQQPWHILLKM